VSATGCRLLTGEQKGRNLNPQLLVCHRLAGLLIAGGHQHREQVRRVRGVTAAFADHVFDGCPEHRPCGLESPVLRRRPPVGEPERPEALADTLVHDGPGTIHLGPERAEVGAQQRTEHDRAGEAHHLFSDIHGPAGRRNHLPLCCGLSRRFGHDAGQRGDAVAMKCRLCNASLAEPELILARQQAVAEGQPQLVV
jgi:hypothetical protein